MTPTRHVTAALLLATVAVTGCSKRGETPTSTAATPDLAPSNPAASRSPSGQIGEEKFTGSSTPAAAGSVTFADAEAAYHAKKYSEATTMYQRYTQQRPGNPWGHYMVGLSSWKNGDLEQAETAFEQALVVDPEHVKSLVNLSRVLMEQKRHDEAIERLTRAANLEPESTEIQRLLGKSYQAAGKTEEAMAVYQKAIEVNERDAWAMNSLGVLLLEQQRADEALPLFARAVELRKDVAVFQSNFGKALEQSKRAKAAADAAARKTASK
jgi:tetratricopeptide (TPR) repeat protein